ncbi:MAG TPA: hypothetical protein VIZ17_09130, partial [Acetobacteraceae bacterium]
PVGVRRIDLRRHGCARRRDRADVVVSERRKGFRPKKKIYKLVFESADMEGLEVAMRSVSIGSMLKMAAVADAAKREEVDAAGLEDMFARFARALEHWNVEDDAGEAVPADLNGVRSQDADFVMAIFEAWFEAVMNVGDDLGKDSSSGGTSPEASLPMAPLSPSPPS